MQGVVRVLAATACALSLSTLCAAGARADVVPVASASVTSTTSPVTTSLAVPAGNDRLLAVGISTTAGSTVTGVTYGAQTLTKQTGATQNGTFATGVTAEIWTLGAPNVGTATITVTFTGDAPAVVGATAFSGVDGLLPILVATASPGEDASNSASIALNTTTAGDGMFGVLALGNVTNTSTPFTQGSTDLVIPDLRWASQAGAVRGAGATRSGNTGQNQATTAGIQWRWTTQQSQLNPHVNAVVALRKAAAAVLPTVTTADATGVGETSATLGGQATHNGNGVLTARGVAYCQSPCTPTVGAPGTLVEQDTTNSTDAFTFTANGLTGTKGYTFRAFATNSAGTGYGEAKSFTTDTPNAAPVASAGPTPQYLTAEGAGVTLNASNSSDADGDPLTYVWDLDLDGQYDDADGVQPALTDAQLDALGWDDGTQEHTISVRVSDPTHDSFASGSVRVANAAPTGTYGSDGDVPEGTIAHVGFKDATDGSSTDLAAGLRYAFDFDFDGAVDVGSLTYANALTTASVALPAALTDDDGTVKTDGVVVDKDGGHSSGDTEFQVTNVAPTATFSEDGPVAEGADAHVTFTDPSDPSGADTTAGFRYAYDLDGDGTWDVGNGTYAGGVTSTTATIPTSDDGPVSVRGAIVDKDDGITTYTKTITVDNAAPSLALAAPGAAQEGTPLTLTLDTTDPSGPDAAADFTYTITWGDGSPVQTVTGPAHATATHAYAAAGSYAINVTATDKDGGASAATTTTATVTAKPAPPVPDTTTTTPAPTPTTTTPAPAPVQGASAPAAAPRITVSGLAVAPRCVRASAATTRSVKLKYKLSGAATVRVTLQRATASKGARTCPPARGVQQDDGTYKPGTYTPVSTQQTTGTSLTIGASAKKGAAASIASFQPRALLPKGAKLKAGTYLITVTPLGADGKPNGTAARVKFWVLKG